MVLSLIISNVLSYMPHVISSRRSSLSYESDEMNNDANLEEDVLNLNDKVFSQLFFLGNLFNFPFICIVEKTTRTN